MQSNRTEIIYKKTHLAKQMERLIFFERQKYEHPEMELLLCGDTCPILESPGGGFLDGEGGLDEEILE